MDNIAGTVLNQTIIMFIILIIGALCYKFRIINDEGKKQLSALVLNVVNPLLIFLSYQTDIRTDLMEGLMWSGIMGALTYGVFIGLSFIIFRNKNNIDTIIERFSIIYSNCGFMGTPLIFGVFGNDGVFIMNGFITMFNLFVWTHGIMTMKGEKNGKTLLKAFRAPAVIAIAAGLVCFFFQLRLPEIPFEALNSIAEMTTPLAMFVAGASIMSAGILNSIKTPRVYLVAAIKNLVFPIIGLLIIMLLPCDDLYKLIVLLEISCPTAAIGTMFAISYNKNAEYSAKIFAVTTILSGLTLPLMSFVGSYVLSLF